MNIFICWSGERSQRLAIALRTCLPQFIPVFQSEPDKNNLFVSEDITKGSRWFDEVERQLDVADAGLVCITREALQSGWIHFEAGALARAVKKNAAKARVHGGTLYTYLLGVQPDELTGPLAEYQSTRFDREDTKRLCAAIVGSMKDDAPPRATWEAAFDEKWNAFAETVMGIAPLPAEKLIPSLEDMFRRKTFNEPLEECTRQSWIDRFTGVRETIAGLKAYRPSMKADNSYLVDLYEDLLEQLDAYAMNMGALLLEEKKFTLDVENGKLVIGNGIKRACESRRGRIRGLVIHLLSPKCAPVLEAESRRYAKMASFDAKKSILIHPAEWEIERSWDGTKTSRASEQELAACAVSLWEFDRVYFYLVQERSESPDLERLVESFGQEFENVRAVDGGSSLIPLHYAMRALRKALPGSAARGTPPELFTRMRLLLASVAAYLDEYDLDKGHQVRDGIREFHALLDASQPGGAALGAPSVL